MAKAHALSPLDAPPWTVAPERALRIAAVAFAGAAAVPSLALCSLVLYAFDMSPVVVWVTAASTMFCAYWVMRLSRARSSVARAVKVLALSVAGGAVNGLAAGALSGFAMLQVEAMVLLATYGAAVGIGYGLVFGIVNLALVAIAGRSSRSPSALGAQRTVANLGAAVAVALLAVVLLVGLDPEPYAHQHDDMTGATRASFALLLWLPPITMLLAAGVALASGVALAARRRWLQRVLRGEESRYRVMPLAQVAAASDLEVLDVGGGGASTAPGILVRIDTPDEVPGGAYRSAEHLTPLARLTR
jgi:hypothetical protein